MHYDFYICDVFTRERFGGNPLAVLPDAAGLDDRRMQQIAREFNFSETTFVLPPEHGHDRRVRIFTPTREVPFAGHPNIGTAYALALNGELGDIGPEHRVTFEEEAGLVTVDIVKNADGDLRCELAAPQGLQLGEVLMPELASSALWLETHDICMSLHPPQVAGVGLPFLVVALNSQQALESARFNSRVMETLQEKGIAPDILLYTMAQGEFDIHARMFAPLDGVPEDPATGSANCALAALLAHCAPESDGRHSLRISQGVEMGRPSVLETTVVKRDGKVVETRLGGDCVMVASGRIDAG